jgi:hypothetical protein
MGFTSQDDLINQITSNGKTDTVMYQRTLPAGGTAGAWTDLSDGVGFPVAPTYSAADVTFTETTETFSEGALPHGGNVSTATKHFLSAGACVVAAAGAPWFLMAVDQVGYVKLSGTNLTTTGTKTVTMTPISNTGATVDRYANGEGLRMYMSAFGAALGANAPTCVVNYSDTGGNAGATTSFTSTATATRGSIINSGASANKFNPFLALQAGDTGVSDIVSVVWSGTAHASGTVILHLVKPLWTIPVPATGLYTKIDFVNAIPSLRRIRDGAHIKFIMFQTGGTTSGGTVFVDFDYAYGG